MDDLVLIADERRSNPEMIGDQLDWRFVWRLKNQSLVSRQQKLTQQRPYQLVGAVVCI